MEIYDGNEKTIVLQQAGHLLLSYIERNDFGDRIYEFAQDFCEEVIRKIESEYKIVDIDGNPYTGDDGEMWYDEYRDDFIKAVFERVAEGKF